MSEPRVERTKVGGSAAWVDRAAAETLGVRADPRWLAAVLGSEPRRVLKEDGRGRVMIADVDGRGWLVKWYRMPAVKSAVYHVARQTPAWRERRGALRLIDIGVDAARPLALVHRPAASPGAGAGGWSQVLIAELIAGKPLSEYLRDNDGTPAERCRLWEAIGRQIGTMTRARWVNRDYKSSNIMVAPGIRPVVVDGGDVRRRRSDRQVRNMFALLHETTTRYGTVAEERFMLAVETARQVDPTIPTIDGDLVWHRINGRVRPSGAV